MPYVLHQEGTTLRHASTRWSGCGAIVIGVAMAIGSAAGRCWESPWGWMAFVICGGFVLVGILLLASTDEMVLDTTARTYVRRSGLWCWVRETTGTFGDFEAVVLLKKERTGKGPSHPTWLAELKWRSERRPRTLGMWFREEEAHQCLEELGRRFRLQMIDSTGEEPVVHRPKGFDPA